MPRINEKETGAIVEVISQEEIYHKVLTHLKMRIKPTYAPETKQEEHVRKCREANSRRNTFLESTGMPYSNANYHLHIEEMKKYKRGGY